MRSHWPLFTLLAAFVGCTSPEEGGERGAAWADVPATLDGGAGTTTCQNVVCDPNAACTGTGAGAACACLPGFEGDGISCADIDECADSALNDCDANAVCTNTPGSYRCACPDGFLGDGRTCTDVDECEGVANTCDPNALCVNTDSGFSCECGPGFQGDGLGCGDVDECADKSLFSCIQNAHCENTFGSYACECDPGFSGEGDTACPSLCDVARAEPGFCAVEGVCRIVGREAVCDSCVPGHTGTGTTCDAVTCDAACDGQGDDDAEHVVCAATGTCECAPGWEGTAGSCTDVAECQDASICGENATCIERPGGYVCDCSPGYELDGSGNCVDIDECAAVPGPCHPDATCTNTTADGSSPGYTCTCGPGFVGDGTVCTDVDECAQDNGGCTAPATCVNLRGSSTCECQSPLVGDPDAGCYCDLSGVWAMRHDTDTCWKATELLQGTTQNLIAEGHMEASVWELYEITYDGNQMQLRGKGCGADNSPDLISPLFRETYSATIPFSTYDALDLATADPFTEPQIAPGSTFSTPSFAGVLGIDLGNDPVGAPWPSSFSAVPASQWVDSDGDGQPGVTLWPLLPSQKTETGTRNYSYLPAKPLLTGNTITIDERAGCLSVAARVITHWDVTVDSCTRMTGEVINEKTEGRVHSCAIVPKGTCDANTGDCTGWQQDIQCDSAFWQSSARCADEDLARLDDDQNQKQNSKATFELIKIADPGDTQTCADVRDALPAIERPVPTITCTTPL